MKYIFTVEVEGDELPFDDIYLALVAQVEDYTHKVTQVCDHDWHDYIESGLVERCPECGRFRIRDSVETDHDGLRAMIEGMADAL